MLEECTPMTTNKQTFKKLKDLRTLKAMNISTYIYVSLKLI